MVGEDMSVILARQEAKVRGSQSKATARQKSTRPYLKNKVKQKGLETLAYQVQGPEFIP